MKKSLFALAAVALASFGLSAHAFDASKDLSVSGSLSGASQYNFRGADFSAGEPSVGAKLKVAHTNGLFGAITTDTIKLRDVNTGEAKFKQGQLHSTLGFGYNHSFGAVGGSDLTVGLGFKHNLFTGKGSVNQLSFSEIYTTAYWNGFSAKLSTNVSGSDVPVAGLNSGDTYGELGYTYKVGKFDVGGDIGYAWYGNKSIGATNAVTHTQLRLGYAVNQNLHLGVMHQFGNGEDGYTKSTGNHRTSVKATYLF